MASRDGGSRRGRRALWHVFPHGEAAPYLAEVGEQLPINVGDAKYNPLFAFGFGLTYP